VAQFVFTRTALDGSSVEISSTVEPAGVFTTDVMTRLGPPGSRRQRFVGGPIGFARQTAFDPEISVGMRLDEEYVLQGGRLQLGWGNQPIGTDGVDYWEHSPSGELRRRPFRIAVWEGIAFSMYAHLYGGESADLLLALDRFTIVETANGLTCTPKDSTTTPIISGPSIMQVMPTLGLVYVRALTKQTAKEVPHHSGTSIAGGELFAAPDPAPYYVLVNETSLTQIFPDDDVPPQDALDSIESMVISWKAAA
jgi:hypothetical protein